MIETPFPWAPVAATLLALALGLAAFAASRRREG
jgi:hypothetical protein